MGVTSTVGSVEREGRGRSLRVEWAVVRVCRKGVWARERRMNHIGDERGKGGGCMGWRRGEGVNWMAKSHKARGKIGKIQFQGI